MLGEPRRALLSEGTAPRAAPLLCQPAHTHSLTFLCAGHSASAQKSPHEAQTDTKAQPTVFVRVCVRWLRVQGELPPL